MKSIRLNLLVVLLGAIACGLLGGAYGTYRLARQQASEIFDYHLRQLALSLRDQPFSATTETSDYLENEDEHFLIQVWGADGSVLYESNPTSRLPMSASTGFSTIDVSSAHWRIYSVRWHDQLLQVAHPQAIRDSLAAKMALRTLLPIMLVFPMLAALIWWIVSRGLSPLKRLAGEVTDRAPGALHPFALEGVPEEALPLMHALNDLLLRLDLALSSQQNFVADAAHELRTPLTALQLHVQLAHRAKTEVERGEALDELRSGLVRASHVVQQLLTLARQEPGAQDEKPFVDIDLCELISQVVADHIRLAEERDIDMGISHKPPSALILGEPTAVRTLVANLVDNALRYTPAGGRVDISITQSESEWVFVIEDSGMGIPIADRNRVFDRFYRRAGMLETGSGLGLAIVRTIAERHGASIRLADSDLGGLSVEVRWPARPVH